MVYEVVDSSAREINTTNDGWPQHEIGTGTGTGPGGTGAGTGTGLGGTGTRTEPEVERDLKRELDGRTCCLMLVVAVSSHYSLSVRGRRGGRVTSCEALSLPLSLWIWE